MAEDNVDVVFDPPRWLTEHGKSYWLKVEGMDDIQLPISLTALKIEHTPDGEVVAGANIPRYIAEDRGLVPSLETNDDYDPDEMTKLDWYMLGLTMALIVRGDDPNDAFWEARKLAYFIDET